VYNRLRSELRGIHDPHGRTGAGLPFPNVVGLVSGYNAALFSYVL
jgi:hypothetical protein